jgi:predicted DNA-binding transcriptional regulator AlpA
MNVYPITQGGDRGRPEHWLVVQAQLPTDEDGETIRLYDAIRSEYGLTNQQLCGMLGISPDRPSKWRSWLTGSLFRQKRPIPEDMHERLLVLKEKLMNDKAPRYLKRPEVATMLRASSMSIGRWSQAGLFPKPIKLGKHYLYDRQEVEDFLANQKSEQGNQK